MDNLQRIARALDKPLACFLEGPATPDETSHEDAPEYATSELVELVSRLSPEEKDFVLEYVRWMVGRKGK